MRLLASMAMKNITRRKARTLLTMGMVVTGTALMVFMIGLSEGTYDEMIDLATSMWTGHFEITAAGYNDKPSLFRTVDREGEAFRKLDKDARLKGLTARIETAGLFSLGLKTTGAMLTGVDPEGEKTVTTIDRAVKTGKWLGDAKAPGKPVVLGTGLAKRLGAKPGDEVSFVGQAADGSIAAELFTVCGLSETGATELDSSAALVRLSDAAELLALGGRVHRLVGRFSSLAEADLPDGGLPIPKGAEYLSWRRIMPAMDKSIKTDRMEVRVIIFILIFVVILGVANTMTMVVMERTHEFGVLSALGTPPATIVSLVLLEGVWLCLFAAGVGVLLGGVANWLTTFHGLPIASGPIDFGGITMSEMHSKNGLFALLGAPAMVVGAGFAAGALPALRAARMKPADAMRRGR